MYTKEKGLMNGPRLGMQRALLRASSAWADLSYSRALVMHRTYRTLFTPTTSIVLSHAAEFHKQQPVSHQELKQTQSCKAELAEAS